MWRLRKSLAPSNVSVGLVVTKNSPLRRELNVKQVLKVSIMAIRVVEFQMGGTKLERFLPKNQHTNCVPPV